MKKKLITWLVLSLFTVSFLVACGKSDEIKEEEKEKINIVASNYPVYALSEKIIGDTANLISLIPEGMEPHDWEPQVQDMMNLEKAKLFLYHGLGMEPWLEKIKESLSNKEMLFVKTSQTLDLIPLEEDEEHHGHSHHSHSHSHSHSHHEGEEEWDPHTWLSLRQAQKELWNIKEALVEHFPEHKEVYEKNYESFAQELKALDEEYQALFAPYVGKHILVSHEAFAYLCRDYQLEQMGIEGVFSDEEPSLAKMKEIIDFIRKNDIKVIFLEGNESSKVVDSIAAEAGVRIAMLDNLEILNQEKQAAGKDYISIMKENLETLKEAFQE